MNNLVSRGYLTEGARDTVIPAYMGLIKQCDDQLGRLLDHLEATGRDKDTMIVLTSDHGDYLGDHWLGEKSLFHDVSARVPLIIYDPSPEADPTRGTVCDAMVEAIDCTATFIEFAGGEVPDHIVEGRSLMPFLHGQTPDHWREFAISEFDYSPTPMAVQLGLAPKDARLFMVADKDWKFMHAEGGFRPLLFDLNNDPEEYVDLGDDPAYQHIIDMMYDRLAQWARRPAQRTTMSDKQIMNMRGKSPRKGILLGLYDGSEVNPELLVAYKGKGGKRFT